jgi:hypothetical protein
MAVTNTMHPLRCSRSMYCDSPHAAVVDKFAVLCHRIPQATQHQKYRLPLLSIHGLHMTCTTTTTLQPSHLLHTRIYRHLALQSPNNTFRLHLTSPGDFARCVTYRQWTRTARSQKAKRERVVKFLFYAEHHPSFKLVMHSQGQSRNSGKESLHRTAK